MIKINGIQVKKESYPDGTPRISLDIPQSHINIEWLYEPSEEMTLFYIVKHIRNCCDPQAIDLYLPYVPNARMDRVKKDDEVFTLKYFCEFINCLEFRNVIVRDVHSNVSLALIDRVICEDISSNINNLIDELLCVNNDVVFYPDEGACKRYSDTIKFPCIFGIKKRDWNTGKILGLDVNGAIPTQPFNALIIDDISSYGGTFFYSAKKLKELGADKIYLYVTHCENSILDGELINSGLLEKIYTTRSIFTKQHDLIEVMGDDNID